MSDIMLLFIIGPTVDPKTQACVDDPRVVCVPSLCNGALKVFCPLTCKTCVPSLSIGNCHDNTLVRCGMADVCSEPSLRIQCPKTCGLCPVPEQITAIVSTLPTTTSTNGQCTDSPMVDCHDKSICNLAILNALCKLSCGLCQGTVSTTITECSDHPAITCEPSSCTDPLIKPLCNRTCSNCGVVSTECSDHPSVTCDLSSCTDPLLLPLCNRTCLNCGDFTSALPTLQSVTVPVSTLATTDPPTALVNGPCKDKDNFECTSFSCRGILQSFCPATCNVCVPDRTCNKTGLLVALAKGSNVISTEASDCGGQSSDALLIGLCAAPVTKQWLQGIKVNDDCSNIPMYSPVAEWNNGILSDFSGVIVTCDNTLIKIVAQSCHGGLTLRDYKSSDLDNLYTVKWN